MLPDNCSISRMSISIQSRAWQRSRITGASSLNRGAFRDTFYMIAASVYIIDLVEFVIRYSETRTVETRIYDDKKY